MIKINVICVGTIKENFLKNGIDEYLKRLSKYAKVEIIEVADVKLQNKANSEILFLEGQNLLKRVKKDDYVILSDLHGKEISSEGFASELKKLIDEGKNPIDFVIGGTLGLADELRQRSNDKLCLSKMTFTHQMTRFILLEQIYRAFKIINNESYHY